MSSTAFSPELMQAVRSKFAQVDACPIEGKRIFFENAGGALTLNKVVERSADHAAIPDNPGRANGMGQDLVAKIAKAKADAKTLLGANTGQIFVGESGTELLFRLVMNACMETEHSGQVISSTLEHPATRSACARWSRHSGKKHILVAHDNQTASVDAAAYAAAVTPDTRVATILHTSPVSGMSVDVAAVAKAIRAIAPDCYIIVDGIQHAAHGSFDIDAYDIDGYVISPYKMFSRHGYGVAWISDRLTALPHDCLIGGPEGNWELGTRDAGAYATLSDVVDYLDWLGGEVSTETDRRTRLIAAGAAIHAHEQAMTHLMLHGTGSQSGSNLKGLIDIEGVSIIGGEDNPRREGLVSVNLKGVDAPDLVEKLRAHGIRTHTRKADYYSANILTPLGLDSCVRVSLAHYNSPAEVAQFLGVMANLAEEAAA